MQVTQFLAPEIRSELEPDENVLWVGQPDAIKDAIGITPIFLFAVPWTAISIFFLITAFTTTKQGQSLGYLSIIGIPFTLLGFLLLSTPFYTYYVAKQTHYIATNRNLYVIVLGKEKSVERYDRADLANISRTEYGARGTLKWSLQGQSRRPSYRGNKQTGEVVFKNIVKPKELELILRDNPARSAK